MLRLLIYLILAFCMLASISCSISDPYRSKRREAALNDQQRRHVKTTRQHSSGIPVKHYKKK